MADIYLKPVWTIALTTEELVLILRSLGGRVKGDAEITRAAELGDRLTVMRANATKQIIQQADAAIDAVTAKVANG